MSKKLEALKDAVFYAQQKPEVLAGLLEGLVTDTATSVALDGPDSVQLKAAGSVTAAYTAQVLSQFGDVMTGTPTIALDGTVTGVSLSSGTVTLTKDVTATSFTIKATSGSLTVSKVVTIAPAPTANT